MSIRKHIPNAITSMNLLCGVLGVICTLTLSDLRAAFLLMIAASVFDFLDGFAARMLGAYSDIGKELDSLSDLVSFGVLPSLMLSQCMYLSGVNRYICLLPLLLAVFSGLRLAKFNIDTRQHESFLGLPTPSAALICSSLTCSAQMSPDGLLADLCSCWWFLPAVSLILCWLLVSEIPMFALKFGTGKKTDIITAMKRTAFLSIAVICIVIVLTMHLYWAVAVTLIFTCYILVNLGFLMAPPPKGREG